MRSLPRTEWETADWVRPSAPAAAEKPPVSATATTTRSSCGALAVPHLQSGRLAPDETVVDGFEHIVDAFLGMLRGENTDKIIVRGASEQP
ncbi:hypothetical protein GCM10027073_51250 [Streptomyces chlorus]